MVRVVIRHDVDDYDTWKGLLEGWIATGEPAGRGVRGHTVYRDVNDPNNVTVMYGFDDEETAQAFVMNSDNRRLLHTAGVHTSGMLMSVVDV